MELTQSAPCAASAQRLTAPRLHELQCLSFNGLLFAPLGCEDLSGCHGMFKVKNVSDYLLYGLDGELRAFIVNNPKQGRFVVSACESSGATRYMFSTCSLDEQWLQLDGVGMMKEDDLIRACRLLLKADFLRDLGQRQLF